jgi:hypothetical protein
LLFSTCISDQILTTDVDPGNKVPLELGLRAAGVSGIIHRAKLTALMMRLKECPSKTELARSSGRGFLTPLYGVSSVVAENRGYNKAEGRPTLNAWAEHDEEYERQLADEPRQTSDRGGKSGFSKGSFGNCPPDDKSAEAGLGAGFGAVSALLLAFVGAAWKKRGEIVALMCGGRCCTGGQGRGPGQRLGGAQPPPYATPSNNSVVLTSSSSSPFQPYAGDSAFQAQQTAVKGYVVVTSGGGSSSC